MKKLGPDFYNITDLLTEEELLIQQTAYDFVQTEFMPVINEHYENATFPMELVPKLGELGFIDRKSTRLNSSHALISYAVFCLKKKKNT